MFIVHSIMSEKISYEYISELMLVLSTFQIQVMNTGMLNGIFYTPEQAGKHLPKMWRTSRIDWLNILNTELPNLGLALIELPDINAKTISINLIIKDLEKVKETMSLLLDYNISQSLKIYQTIFDSLIIYTRNVLFISAEGAAQRSDLLNIEEIFKLNDIFQYSAYLKNLEFLYRHHAKEFDMDESNPFFNLTVITDDENININERIIEWILQVEKYKLLKALDSAFTWANTLDGDVRNHVVKHLSSLCSIFAGQLLQILADVDTKDSEVLDNIKTKAGIFSVYMHYDNNHLPLTSMQ